MISGLYPRHHQLITNGMALPESVPVLPRALVDNGYQTHAVGKQHLQPILAPAEYNMPDSRAFWKNPDAASWHGAFYGYQTIDILLGESDTAQVAGHYGHWLRENYPKHVECLKPEFADPPPPEDLDEIWRSAMPVKCHYNTWITDRAIDFLIEQKAARSPFCLFVSYPDPHHPFDPPAEYADRYHPDDMKLPEVPDCDLAGRPSYCRDLFPKGQGFRKLYWRADESVETGSTITTENISKKSMQKAIAYTHAQVEMIDDGVGRMLALLRESGVDENTVVIFTSDHGEYLGDHGLLHKGPASYRQLTELPFLVSGPGIQPGRQVSSLTSHIDIMPTLLSLTGTDSKADMDGVSLKPLLEGSSKRVRDYTFGEYHPTVRKELYNQTVYKDQWRMTIYPEAVEWGELFDLDKDPLEHYNCYFESGFDSVKQELAALLRDEFPPQITVENKVLAKW